MQRRGRSNRQPRRDDHQSSSDAYNAQQRDTAPTHSSTSRGSRGSRGSRPLTNHRPARAYPDSVPARAQIHPSTRVSIVLKADQPTGRQVQGTVADVLTKGDHPRGVKVRLSDGRVGRVQRFATEQEVVASSQSSGGAGVGDGGRTAAPGTFRHVRDVREDDEYLFDEAGGHGGGGGKGHFEVGGLFKALEEADQRHATERTGRTVKEERKQENAVCPVCGEFEGDETAVARHVEEHFEGT